MPIEDLRELHFHEAAVKLAHLTLRMRIDHIQPNAIGLYPPLERVAGEPRRHLTEMLDPMRGQLDRLYDDAPSSVISR